ncbi:MAG: hypothetical protein KDC83_11445 [Flavobacteriales bacterium]|nr:hypothetical protein [Flavobacteriales bacterium]
MHKLILILPFVLIACNSKTPESPENKSALPPTSWALEIQNLSKTDYPDNPDWGFEATSYHTYLFNSGLITKEENGYTITFLVNKQKDTITLRNVDLSEFIPTVPSSVKDDEYLTKLTLVNQEWNRNQVNFIDGQFSSSNPEIICIDLARNCLNSYLWEVSTYVNEDEIKKTNGHGWFNFPKDLYASLFVLKNGFPFEKYASILENWVDPESKKINHDLLAKKVSTVPVSFVDSSDAMYPLQGARIKKRKEIIFPLEFQTMRDLQSDSTLFATFSPPGYYNRADPRVTQLGRTYSLNNVKVSSIKSMINGDTLSEITLSFNNRQNSRFTKLVIGGLDMDAFPKLSTADANNGWKSAMGFSNHTFYENYTDHLKCKSARHPYFAYLSDEDGKWLDSHQIGIDGPIMHWDNVRKNVLHIWLLSFERHALVGHYLVEFKTK